MLLKTKRLGIWLVLLGLLFPMIARAQSENLEDLHKKALKEGGTVNFYGTLAQINAEKILPVFEKRFPGMKVNHVDATADKLAARAITEARGGRVLVDVFQMALENVLQVVDQKLTVDWLPPEAAAYPANLKGSNWLAADMVIITASWNTNLVKKDEVPKTYEQLLDPKWKGKKISIDDSAYEFLAGLMRAWGKERPSSILKSSRPKNPSSCAATPTGSSSPWRANTI